LGLPEKIKNTLARRATKDTSGVAVPQAGGSPSRADGQMSSGKGLPDFKPPELPSGYRAMLVVCAQKGKASWAVLKSIPGAREAGERGWRFHRNLRAVPETRRPSQAPQQSARVKDSSADGTISMRDVDLSAFSCGVCGGHGEYAGRLVQCGACDTLQCQPAEVWTCPGCGGRIGEQSLGTIESVAAEEGSRPVKANQSIPAPGGETGGSTPIGQSRSVSAPGIHQRPR